MSDGRISAQGRSCEAIFDEFGSIVHSDSVAIIARSLSHVQQWVSNEETLYVSFQRQLASSARLPNGNAFDDGRRAAEDLLFPNYSEHINFAALALGSTGAAAFGGYNVILKSDAIKLRATVLEENPFHFIRRHQIFPGTQSPSGFRAIWSERHLLAQAKLHHSIETHTTSSEFPQILMQQGTGTADVNYIEVNIFGPIHRKAIDKVTGPSPKGPEKVIARSLARKLAEFGASLELN